MDMSVGSRLGFGDRVRFAGLEHVVTGFTPAAVRLDRPLDEVPVRELVSSPDFAVMRRGPFSRQDDSLLPGLPTEAVTRALWWERHLLEVLHGPPTPPGGEGSAAGVEHGLASREADKAAELTALGVPGTSARTVRRKRQRFQAEGILGLIDGRALREAAPGARTDPRVLNALLTVLSAHEGGPDRPMEFYRERTLSVLAQERGGDAALMPSRATFYRLLKQLSSRHGSQGDTSRKPSPTSATSARKHGSSRPSIRASWLRRHAAVGPTPSANKSCSRIILALESVRHKARKLDPHREDEGKAAIRLVKEIIRKIPGLRAVTYDTALRGVHRAPLIADGLIVFTPSTTGSNHTLSRNTRTRTAPATDTISTWRQAVSANATSPSTGKLTTLRSP
nr:hypothetical protein OH820_13545 [Streptomyces sp. NBC_00857]